MVAELRDMLLLALEDAPDRSPLRDAIAAALLQPPDAEEQEGEGTPVPVAGAAYDPAQASLDKARACLAVVLSWVHPYAGCLANDLPCVHGLWPLYK